jgi:hypothetical protein
MVWQLLRAAEGLEFPLISTTLCGVKKFRDQEEIREIFKRHRVPFDERYVWD